MLIELRMCFPYSSPDSGKHDLEVQPIGEQIWAQRGGKSGIMTAPGQPDKDCSTMRLLHCRRPSEHPSPLAL